MPLDTLWHTLDLGHCAQKLGHYTMSLMCHLESREPPPWSLHPFEEFEVWFDDVALDDDNTPLWRGHGGPLFDGRWDVAHVMGHHS
jgi:hypothetical protein